MNYIWWYILCFSRFYVSCNTVLYLRELIQDSIIYLGRENTVSVYSNLPDAETMVTNFHLILYLIMVAVSLATSLIGKKPLFYVSFHSIYSISLFFIMQNCKTMARMVWKIIFRNIWVQGQDGSEILYSDNHRAWMSLLVIMTMMVSSNGKNSALMAICAGNSPVLGEFPAQRSVTWSCDFFLDLRLNKRLRKQSWGWWFETLSRSLWRHRNGYILQSIRITQAFG